MSYRDDAVDATLFERVRERATTRVRMAVLFLVAVLAHVRSLGYWFPSSDTIPLIESSRVATVGDLATVLTGPLMQGTRFTDVGLFYRPVSSLSYALDYALWGLSPFGYHLTNLVLHGIAAVLVALAISEMTERPTVGYLSALLFALHPITVEVVPAVARRQDVLMTIFALASLTLFVRSREGDGLATATRSVWARRRTRLASVAAFLLAVGAKELALLLPGVIGVWTLSRQPLELDRELVLDPVRAVLPFAATIGAYFVLRIEVLGGVGGYRKETSLPPVDAIVMAAKYLVSITYPQNVFGFTASADAPAVLAPVALLPVAAALLAGLGVWRSYGRVRVPRMVGGVYGVGCLGVLGTLPLVLAARGRIVSALQVDLSSVVFGYVVGLLFVGGCTVGLLAAFLARETPIPDDVPRSLFTFVAWILLPLPIFFVGGHYTLRSGYLFAVPVVAAVALVLVVSGRAVVRCGESSPFDANDASVVLCLLLLFPLVVTTPLVHPYGGWNDVGETNRVVLTGLTDELADRPADTHVVLDRSPRGVERQLRAFPRVKSAGFLHPNTVESWLRLQDPGNEMRIGIKSTVRVCRPPEHVTFRTIPGERVTVVRLSYDDQRRGIRTTCPTG